jgi:hypothetical protein
VCGLSLEMAKASIWLIEEFDVWFLSRQYLMPWELFIPNIGCKPMQT